MRIRAFLLLAVVSLTGCSSFSKVVHTVDRQDRFGPPNDFARPGYVRYTARTGAWLGGVVGAFGSIATLPLTWPLTLVADEPLGCSKDELLFWGISAGAGGGHFLFGAPVDSVDWVFRRAWVDAPAVTGFEFTPADAPLEPRDE